MLGIQKQIIALNNEIDQVEEKLKGIVLEGDRTKEAMGRLESEISQIGESRKQYQVEFDDTDWQLKELRSSTKESGKSLQKLQQEFHEKRAEEAKLAKEQAELQTAILSLTRQYAQLKAEADVAENMKRGYTAAVTAILECRETGSIKGIHGTVAQLAHVDPQYETAIVTAAGARMQAIIVDDDTVAAQCIDFLKRRKIGRATFLPLSKMLVGKPRGKAILVAKECLGFAIDLCHFDEKYRDAFFYVFGDTLVVQTLDEARKWMGGVRLVTVEGELIEASGAMIGGDMERSTVKFGPSAASEMEKIAEKLREAQAHAENVANLLDGIRKEILDLEGTIKDSGGKSGAVEVKASTLEAKRREFTARLAAADKDLTERKDRFDLAEKTAKRIEEDLTKFSKALEALKAKRDERKKAVIEATPQQISSRMKELMSRRATLAEELSGLRSKLEAMETQTAFLEERRGEVDARIGTLDDQRKDHEKRIESNQESLGRLETEIRGLEKTEATGRQVSPELLCGQAGVRPPGADGLDADSARRRIVVAQRDRRLPNRPDQRPLDRIALGVQHLQVRIQIAPQPPRLHLQQDLLALARLESVAILRARRGHPAVHRDRHGNRAALRLHFRLRAQRQARLVEGVLRS